MTEHQNQSATQPTGNSVQGVSRSVAHHKGQLVEHTAQHTAGQPESIQTDIGKYVAHQPSSHIIRVPQSGTDIGKNIAVEIIQQIDTDGRHAADHKKRRTRHILRNHFHKRKAARTDETDDKQQPSPIRERLLETVAYRSTDGFHRHGNANVHHADNQG